METGISNISYIKTLRINVKVEICLTPNHTNDNYKLLENKKNECVCAKREGNFICNNIRTFGFPSFKFDAFSLLVLFASPSGAISPIIFGHLTPSRNLDLTFQTSLQRAQNVDFALSQHALINIDFSLQIFASAKRPLILAWPKRMRLSTENLIWTVNTSTLASFSPQAPARVVSTAFLLLSQSDESSNFVIAFKSRTVSLQKNKLGDLCISIRTYFFCFFYILVPQKCKVAR